MRKNLYVVSLVLLFSGIILSQQKIGYIDSKIILENMQDAKDAQQTLDNLVEQWKNDLQVLNDSLQLLKEDYEKKKLILTENIKQQKEADISAFEKKISEFKNNKFSENGEYFQKQNELMKPVLNRIFQALQEVAREGNFDFVFDRNSEIILLYMNEKYDLTQKVIKKLEAQ